MSLALIPLVLIGCMGHARIVYLQPAEIALPPVVETLAPVDRIGTPTSDLALQEFTDTLALSPRVKVVDRRVAQQAYAGSPSMVGAEIPLDTLKEICSKTKATGVVALETLQNGEAWGLDRHPEVRKETVTVTDPATGAAKTSEVSRTVEVFRATVNVNVTTLWRTYDCAGQMLDRFDVGGAEAASGEGDSESAARGNVPPIPDLMNRAARQAGASYARRIAPYQVEADRLYYKGGSKEIKAGRKAVEVNDWTQAQTQWETASSSSKDKVKGKAFYNLAVAAEQAGQIKKAIELAEKADNLLSNKKTAAYVAVLKQRQKDKARLKDQMGD